MIFKTKETTYIMIPRMTSQVILDPSVLAIFTLKSKLTNVEQSFDIQVNPDGNYWKTSSTFLDNIYDGDYEYQLATEYDNTSGMLRIGEFGDRSTVQVQENIEYIQI